MSIERYVAGLRRQIAGDERELARLNECLDVRYEWAAAEERDGVALCIEELRAELRFQLGEPAPMRH